jgi:hypothetical protein
MASARFLYWHSLSWWTKFDIKVNILKISFHHVYDDEIVDQKMLKKKSQKEAKRIWRKFDDSMGN